MLCLQEATDQTLSISIHRSLPNSLLEESTPHKHFPPVLRLQVATDQEGYAGDKSSDASSENEVESSVRSILPLLARVAMPTPDPGAFGFDELLARGGRPIGKGVVVEEEETGGEIKMDDFDF